ncbi:beta strand repeat-containing protein [Yoonia sp. R2331]|uniref:beta strand repeat-containing protein n=1 Tax=Yoonia sp. R2331 TaxID=3237238 RepID=UPI0034E3D484
MEVEVTFNKNKHIDIAIRTPEQAARNRLTSQAEVGFVEQGALSGSSRGPADGMKATDGVWYDITVNAVLEKKEDEYNELVDSLSESADKLAVAREISSKLVEIMVYVNMVNAPTFESAVTEAIKEASGAADLAQAAFDFQAQASGLGVIESLMLADALAIYMAKHNYWYNPTLVGESLEAMLTEGVEHQGTVFRYGDDGKIHTANVSEIENVVDVEFVTGDNDDGTSSTITVISVSNDGRWISEGWDSDGDGDVDDDDEEYEAGPSIPPRPRPGSIQPVVLDLDGDGIGIISGSNAWFDVDDDGFRERTSWISPNDGFLVIDLNSDGSRGIGDGQIDQTRELAFSFWGQEGDTDLQALKREFDSNGDGVIDESDSVWAELRVWRDLNGNGISEEGEIFHLGEFGIENIGLSHFEIDGSSEVVPSGYIEIDFNNPFNDVHLIGAQIKGYSFLTIDGVSSFDRVIDLSLDHDKHGFRRVDTAFGYDIVYEAGGRIRIAELAGKSFENYNLTTDMVDGAIGDADANTLDATGHTLAVEIDGRGGDDIVLGGHGDDVLSGGSGVDKIKARDGNDTLIVNAADFGGQIGSNGRLRDLIDGGNGIDTIIVDGTSGVTIDLAEHRVEAAYGNEGADTLDATGLTYDTPLYGGDGADTIKGGNGNDHLDGGAGADSIFGGNGTDNIFGGSGADKIWAGVGDDIVTAGDNDDTVVAETGDDLVMGGGGLDVIAGREGDDYLNGDDGHDSMHGGSGDDVVYGGKGNDTIGYWRGDDALFGGDGDDVFEMVRSADDVGFANQGWSILRGGKGNDTLILNRANSSNIEFDHVSGNQWQLVHSIASGTIVLDLIDIETVEFSDGSSVVLSTDDELDSTDYVRQNYATMGDDLANVGDDPWSTSGTLFGFSGADHISGDGDGNAINAGFGSDTVMPGAGNDSVVGGTGGDNLHGGDGQDDIAGGSGSDNVFGGDGQDTIAAGSGSDLVNGGIGGDTIHGGSGDDALGGGGGTDWIYGQDGHDLIEGHEGIDRLFGGTGVDRLHGGNGTDTVHGGAGADRVFGNLGDDTLFGGNGADHLDGGYDSDTVYGDNDDDVVFGNDGADFLYGGNGRDILNGGEGADVLDGGGGVLDSANYQGSSAGINVDLLNNTASGGHATGDILTNIEGLFGSEHDDVLRGDDSDNVLEGGDGDDTISGRNGHDILTGGAGGDTIYAGEGHDRAWGGAGDDFVQLGDGNDSFFGTALGTGAGQDTVYGGAGADELYGGGFDDILDGGADEDTILAAAGNDVLIGGTGADSLNGGTGIDTLDYSDVGLSVRIDLGAADGIHGLTGAAEGDRIVNVETLLGSAQDDDLSGDDNANTFYGRGGADDLFGSDGQDALFGGNGIDTLHGGDGADWLSGDAAADTIIGGNGNDTVSYASSNAAVSINLTTNTASGGHATGDVLQDIESAEGSAFADTLIGTDGDNTLWGLGGGDVISGGLGLDTVDYAGSLAGVTIDLSATTITASGGHANGDTLTSIESLKGTDYSDDFMGNVDVNVLEGRDGDDVLNGREGEDTLYGQLGNDTLSGGNGNDYLHAGIGDDFLYGGADTGNDFLVGGRGADAINGGDGIDTADYSESADGVTIDLSQASVIGVGGEAAGDTLTGIENLNGSETADHLTGGTGTNVIDGLAGHDTLFGRWGNDTLYGRLGGDTLDGGFGNDVLDGGHGDDRIIGGADDGNDVMTGGVDSDTFVFADVTDLGDDIITDFTVGKDKIEMAGVTFADLTISTVNGNDVQVAWNNSTLILEDVDLSDISNNDFVFV